MKVAIVHDYLHVVGGAEGVANAIWEIYPDADVYSSTCDWEALKKADIFQGAKIIYPKWKNNIPGKLKNFSHKLLVANLPIYFQRLDLKKYDLVLSSSAHFAKGVRTGPNQLHVSYIHTPPRFLYGYPGEIRKRTKWYLKPIFWPIDTVLRVIDKIFAKRPDYLLCNSREVKKRIKKFYKRDAKVINPFPTAKVIGKEILDAGYFLVVSRLAEYKNVDLCIKTCGENNIPLIVVGTGPAEATLKKLAEKYESVKMLGFVDSAQRDKLYRECKSVLCTVQNEDFGMVPLEAMLYGKPVVALKDAGYLETVKENETGIFFKELTEESLLEAIKKLKSTNFDYKKIKRHSKKFSKERFQAEYKNFIDKKLKEKGIEN